MRHAQLGAQAEERSEAPPSTPETVQELSADSPARLGKPAKVEPSVSFDEFRSSFLGAWFAPAAPVEPNEIDARTRSAIEAASIAVYQAVVGKVDERGVIQIIATEAGFARRARELVADMFDGVPLLSPLVRESTSEGIALHNGITVECVPIERRRVDGRSIISLILLQAPRAAALGGMELSPIELARRLAYAVMHDPEAALAVGAVLGHEELRGMLQRQREREELQPAESDGRKRLPKVMRPE